MRRRSVASAIAIAALTLSPVTHAQTPAGAQAGQGRGGQAGGRRGAQLLQHKDQVVMLYQNTRTFRTIWTDGREIHKDITEPRWFGYSVGKWTDPTTLVVTTAGLNDSTWIDNVGRPHSDELVVEETYHRVDDLNIELTVKITDPVMYTQPWYPLKNFSLGKIAPEFDIR